MIRDASPEELVAFHRGIYWDAFAAQHEPLEVWQRENLPYARWVRLAFDELGIAGGIVFERYPVTGCGLLTYLVVAPHARVRGIGRALVDDALAVLHDAPAIYGEVNDPATQTREPRDVAERRLATFERWGAQLVDLRYVQPALAPGLPPDETLRLIAWRDASPDRARQFLDEFTASFG